MFDAGVGAIDVEAHAVADEHAEDGVLAIVAEGGGDADGGGLAGVESGGFFSEVVEELDGGDFAELVAVAVAAEGRGGVAELEFVDEADVAVDDVVGGADGDDFAVEHEGGAGGEALDHAEVVGDEEDGDAAFLKFFKFVDAAVGEDGVADGEGFVDDENFGLNVDGGGEGEADVHAAGILFYGAVHEVADFGEGGDGGEGGFDFGAGETDDLAVEDDVFAAGEFGVEAGAEFEERGDAAGGDDSSAGGLHDAGDDLEEGAFAGAVRADEGEDFAGFHGDGDIAEGPEILRAGFVEKRNGGEKPVRRGGEERIDLRDVLDGYQPLIISDILQRMGYVAVIPRRAALALTSAMDWLNEREVVFQLTGDAAARFYGAKLAIRELELTVAGSAIERWGQGVGWQRDAAWERLTMRLPGVTLVSGAARCFEVRRGRWVSVRANLVQSTWFEWRGIALPVEPRGLLLRRYERLGEDEPVRQILTGSHMS